MVQRRAENGELFGQMRHGPIKRQAKRSLPARPDRVAGRSRHDAALDHGDWAVTLGSLGAIDLVPLT